MRPGTQRWRSFGQDGVVEMQLNCHDWWNKKLLSRLARFDVLQAPAAPHEHLVTERSLSAMAQAMTVAQTPLTLPSTTPTTSCRPTTTSDQGPNGLSSDRARPHSGHLRDDRQVEAHGATTAGSRRMARPWIALMVAAATASAVCSLPISKHLERQAVGRTSGLHDCAAAQSHPQGALHEKLHQPGLRDQEPGGTGSVPQSCWPAVRLRRGQPSSRNAGSPCEQGHHYAVEEGSFPRGSNQGSSDEVSGRSRSCRSTADRTKGWPTVTQSRPHSPGCPPQRDPRLQR